MSRSFTTISSPPRTRAQGEGQAGKRACLFSSAPEDGTCQSDSQRLSKEGNGQSRGAGVRLPSTPRLEKAGWWGVQGVWGGGPHGQGSAGKLELLCMAPGRSDSGPGESVGTRAGASLRSQGSGLRPRHSIGVVGYPFSDEPAAADMGLATRMGPAAALAPWGRVWPDRGQGPVRTECTRAQRHAQGPYVHTGR